MRTSLTHIDVRRWFVPLSVAAPILGLADVACRTDSAPNTKVEVRPTEIQALRATFPSVLRDGSPLAHLDGDLIVGEATRTRLVDSPTSRKASVWRKTRYGVEDFVAIPDAGEDDGSLDYIITLAEWTKGLRLFERTLELLDRNGVPRLRMAAPYLIDREQNVHALEVAVSGCGAVDTSPLLPFGRPLQALVANQCALRVSWRRSGLKYPVLVDPGWSKTTSMATTRYRHISHKLPNGDVLVTGGLTFVADKEIATAASEIYSAANGAWSTAASMIYPRAFAADATLSNGDVLITGGYDQTVANGQSIHPSSEIYAVATGLWSKTTGDLITPRAGHSVGELGDGSVLIAGGFDNSGDHFTATEIFMPATSSFVTAGDLNNTRYFQAGVALGNGKVLLSGGTDPQAGALASLELYTKGVGWTAAANLPLMTKRTFHTMVALSNGDALIAGGFNTTDRELATAEIYHTATNTIEKLPDTFTKSRYELTGVALPGGKALFIGGQVLMGHFADGELYDPGSQPKFLRVRGMSDERALGHKATTLDDGRVLVSGGYEPHFNRSLASADVFDINADAGPYLPDEEEREAGAPDANPHGDIDAGCVWPCAGDGRPTTDASTTNDGGVGSTLPANTESKDDANAFSPLTGGGSGCGVAPVNPNENDIDRGFVVMLVSFASAMWLLIGRCRRGRGINT